MKIFEAMISFSLAFFILVTGVWVVGSVRQDLNYFIMFTYTVAMLFVCSAYLGKGIMQIFRE